MYHVLNRANARMRIFDKPDDYAAFEQVLEAAVERTKTRLLAYCVLPTHWHMVLWPREDGELSRFTGWLTLTHTQRWHAHRHSTGSGHLYQGRFKSFPVQDDGAFLHGLPLRGAQRSACQPGRARGGLALGKSPSVAGEKRQGTLGRLAPAAFGELGAGGQCTASGGRVGGAAAIGGSRLSFRRGPLVRPNRTSFGAGEHGSSPRASKET